VRAPRIAIDADTSTTISMNSKLFHRYDEWQRAAMRGTPCRPHFAVMANVVLRARTT
jgi:hypothetical protein